MSFILLAMLIVLIRAYPVQIVALILSGFAVRHFLKRRSTNLRQLQLHAAQDCTKVQIERHKTALVSYFRQSIRGDLFGNEDTTIWHRHIRTFLQTQVGPELSKMSIAHDDALAEDLVRYVDRAVRSEGAKAALLAGSAQIDPAKLTAVEYEHHCAAVLFRCGWTVHPTPASGDHGADVIAQKNGHVMVVQCKLYSQPVGNKAVQEVNAARPLYNASHACVVAPAGFTRQAQREAHALSIRLLHHTDLEAFAEELTEQSNVTPKRAVRA